MTQNTAAVIQAITSIVNLIFVGGIFIFERRTGKKGINDEKKEFWYRQTLLSRGLDLTGNVSIQWNDFYDHQKNL